MNKPTVDVRFFKTNSGAEPVRDWLRELPAIDRKTIGEDIKTVQFGWPLGMPLVRKMDKVCGKYASTWRIVLHECYLRYQQEKLFCSTDLSRNLKQHPRPILIWQKTE